MNSGRLGSEGAEHLQSFEDAGQVAKARLWAQFARAAAQFPHGYRRWLPTVTDPAAVIPAGVRIEASMITAKGGSVFLVSGPGWTGAVEQSAPEQGCHLTVVASDEERAREVVEECVPVDRSIGSDDSSVWVTFWSKGAAASKVARRVTCPAWSDVAKNYPGSDPAPLDELMRSAPPGEFDGRLLIWHGPPGTGKTTALRTLARSWTSWAWFDYVVDGERFLQDPGYVMEIALAPNRRQRGELFGEGSVWRVLVVEEADQLIGRDAPRSGGLGMLLNVTDGILSQGTRTLFLLTTNRRLAALDEALLRPGRLLRQVEFRTFQHSEARHWLDEAPLREVRDYSLAELFAIMQGRSPAAPLGSALRGQYV